MVIPGSHASHAPPHPPRLLEHQLQTQKRSNDVEVEALRGELQSVKEENNRQQQLLAQNLQLPPEARIEASLQHEITRLTNENLVGCTSGNVRSDSDRREDETEKLLDGNQIKPKSTFNSILIFVPMKKETFCVPSGLKKIVIQR